MINKKQLKKEFSREWKKYYEVKFLKEQGFFRQKCKKCGNYFWSIIKRENCGDASCNGYTFIGKKLSKKSLDYLSAWDEIKNYFEKTGHSAIEPYPVIARWRDDLYFTNASIIDFQPYAVKGEVEPPANPLIVPQPCIRFPDITNVGVTGRHYTNFIMLGQHAFNSKKTGLFYWKNEALKHDFNFLHKALGLKAEVITFKEDVWSGGGNFGASMEYFVEGLELGNCVFMEFEEHKNKIKELETKVIDMGAGYERFPWLTQGLPTSYEITFGPVIEKMKKDAGIKVDQKLFLEFAKLSGALNIDEVENLKKEKTIIAKKLKVDENELFKMLEPLHALYASCDHLKTLLFAVTDGGLPSNTGGGYNLRMALRRVFALNEEFNLNIKFDEVINAHANFLRFKLFPRLKEGSFSAISVIEEEKKKFEESKRKGKEKIITVIKKLKKEKKELNEKELIKLYESDGIPMELVEEISRKENFEFKKPDEFYSLVQKKNELKKEQVKVLDLKKYEKTKKLYYENYCLEEFTATVIGLEDDYVILDKTSFYPESGGQSFDLGVLGESTVKEVIVLEDIILHQVNDIEKFKKGMKVFGKIDLKRRKQLQRQHSAAHLLNAACYELLGSHVWQAGSKKEVEKAHLDITHFKKLNEEELKKIELIVNQRILEGIKVNINLMKRNEAEKQFGMRIYQGGAVPGKELRIININEVDVEACGGIHVNNTAEIGFFKIIKREGIQDGVERIVFTTGIKALELVQEQEKLLRDIAECFKVPLKEVYNAAEKFFSEWKKQAKEIEKLKETLIKAHEKKINELKEKKIKIFIPNLDQKNLIQLSQRIKKDLILIASNEIIISVSKKKEINALNELKKVCKEIKSKIGGNNKIAFAKHNDIEKVKKEFKEINEK